VKRSGSTPHWVERRSTRDWIELIAAVILGIANLVFLGTFVFRGPTPPLFVLLTITLAPESITLISRSWGERTAGMRRGKAKRL
jgi:hypothetical protein